jgi:hypothetical protein
MAQRFSSVDGVHARPKKVSGVWWFTMHTRLLIVMSVLVISRYDGIWSTTTDWHAWRQSDTASVTREYAEHGIDLLHPRYLDLSNVASGLNNPEGYRMVEFPLVNAGVAAVVRALHLPDVVVPSRIASALFSIIAGWCMYQLARRWWGEPEALSTVLAFALLPYARFYSRAVLPEPALVMCMCLSVWCVQQWWDAQTSGRKGAGWWSIGVISLAIALLLKPFAILVVLPMLGIVAPAVFTATTAGLKHKWTVAWESLLRILPLLCMIGIAVVPLMAWRIWILQYPEGIPANTWLFNGNGIRWRPAWFRWLFYERYTKLILGWFGVIVVAWGGWLCLRAKHWPMLGWAVGVIVYLSIVATGNVQHDYYQYLTLPPLMLVLGVATGHALRVARGMHRARLGQAWQFMGAIGMLCMLPLGSIAAWQYVAGYYGTRGDWEQAGQAVARQTPSDALVIAPADGDTGFLFQTHRRGWPMGMSIEEKRAQGASYYVSTRYDAEAKELEQHYTVTDKTSQYILIDLTRPRSESVRP